MNQFRAEMINTRQPSQELGCASFSSTGRLPTALKKQINKSRIKSPCARLQSLGLIVVTLTGCASVKNVNVQPPMACPGDPVTVSWRATGDTKLFQVPLKAGQSDQCIDTLISGLTPLGVRSHDEQQLSLQQKTVFYVEARGLVGKPAHRCATGLVDEALPLAGISQCVAPRRVGITVARPSDSKWSTRARVGPVKNINDVAVTVRHAGVAKTLAPGEASEAFANDDPGGDWTVEYDLADGPDCGKVGSKAPASLSIQVLPHCAT